MIKLRIGHEYPIISVVYTYIYIIDYAIHDY